MTNKKDKFQVVIVGGAGHVGIPLALSFAHVGIKTLIYDIDRQAIEKIKAGQLPFLENGGEALLKEALDNRLLFCTLDKSQLKNCDAIIFTIGTPIDEFLNPVNKAVKNCIDEILPYIEDNQLVILRSTIFPGTTEWFGEYFKSKNKKIKVAFCPERIVQGNGINELKTLPQIISGTTEEAAQEAAKLFLKISPEVVFVKPKEAEFAKLFNNAYRYIEFAAANQFYMIAHSAGVDYQKVMHAMKYHYPRSSKMPGPGFSAGPCLLKDTMQLAAFSGNQFSLGHSAMLINEGIVLYIVNQLERDFDLKNLRVGILGMAFKADIDDSRSSLSYKLKKILSFKAKEVLITDPYVEDREIVCLDELINKCDIFILCAPHKVYQGIDLKDKPIVDIWGFFEKK